MMNSVAKKTMAWLSQVGMAVLLLLSYCSWVKIKVFKLQNHDFSA